jgi:DNA-binding GntR family transcriptional regulator
VNHLFHTGVQAAAGNRWLDRVTNDLRGFMRLLRGRQLQWPGRLEASIAEHREFMAALLARDAARAERVMHGHLIAQLQALRQLHQDAAASAHDTGERHAG